MANPDDDMVAVLARYRAAKSPNPLATTAAWERIQTQLAAGPQIATVVEADADLAAPTGRATQSWIRWGTAALAIAAVIALAVSLDIGGVLQSQSDAGREQIEAPYVDERDSQGGVAREADPPVKPRVAPRRRDSAAVVPVTTSTMVDPANDDAALDEPAADPAVVLAAEPKQRKPKRAPERSPKADTNASIAAELALLREAQSAIAGGNPSRALAKLRQHTTNFPNSIMVQERELAKVRALCALGRSGDASKAAARFRRKFSGSHLMQRLNTTCASEAQ